MNLEYRPRRRAVPSAFHFRYEYLFTSALCYLLYPSVDTYLLPSVDTYLLTYLLYLDKGEPRWPLLDPGARSRGAPRESQSVLTETVATGTWRPGRVSPRSVLADRGSARARAGPRESKAGCDVRASVPPEHGAVRGCRWAALHVPRVDVAQAAAAYPAEAPLPRRLRRVGVWRGDYSSMILSRWRSGGKLPGEPSSSPTATAACTAGAT